MTFLRLRRNKSFLRDLFIHMLFQKIMNTRSRMPKDYLFVLYEIFLANLVLKKLGGLKYICF